MQLCIDVGNTSLKYALFKDEICLVAKAIIHGQNMLADFFSSLENILASNGFKKSNINKVGIVSVKPSLDAHLYEALLEYINFPPLFFKNINCDSLKFAIKHVDSIGTDRVANIIAAQAYYPNTDLIVIDMGTATTFCYLSSDGQYKGGPIIPGVMSSLNSLIKNAEKLEECYIISMDEMDVSSTVKSIQSGVYYSQLGGLKEILFNLREMHNLSTDTRVIGTGGYANLFNNKNIFSEIIPNLTLEGLNIYLQRSNE